MLSVFMVSVFMLSVFMLSVSMLSVFMLSVFMLSVVLLNVVAPTKSRRNVGKTQSSEYNKVTSMWGSRHDTHHNDNQHNDTQHSIFNGAACLRLPLITEGSTEKVSQFSMTLKSAYNKNVCLNELVALNNSEGFIQKIFIITCCFNGSVYLFRTALCELIWLFHKGVLFHCNTQ